MKKEIKLPVHEGDPAPAFEAKTTSGETIRLADLAGKNVVLYFYPKDDTPGCTKEACGFRDAYADFQARGGVIWACPPCVKARGYGPEDLLDGVAIQGASAMHAEIKAGAATLSV